MGRAQQRARSRESRGKTRAFRVEHFIFTLRHVAGIVDPDRTSEPEICDEHPTIITEQDIVRFEVTMDESLVVGCLQSTPCSDEHLGDGRQTAFIGAQPGA